ncbi:hypothetical protein BJ508DRAFT_210570 [Ascobolus immersus RN42]|uniref:Rab-GAP TBC domain-containing protein n=1 Tax=Ascobolus immersus RN42 TaxID=1160509 RepID=A0A3N4I1S2_ASCIM|nr:hypothetical protein BJ508DRAFT_210570 [Ascobolus immersus RN42]
MVSISLSSDTSSDDLTPTTASSPLPLSISTDETGPKPLVSASIPQLPPTPSSPDQSAFTRPPLARTPTLKLVTDTESVEVEGPGTGRSSMVLDDQFQTQSPVQTNSNRSSVCSMDSSDLSNDVDWRELETKEESTSRTEQEQEEQTAFLIARLERENSRLEKDPKSGLRRADTRPPSMHQLKLLMTHPSETQMRYSMLPSPPPLTDLDFYAALVADYPRCAAKLPFLLSKKIRAGIPPPLRGVVWISMAGARDATLEALYEQLLGETSPYESLIGKDVGRTGLEMFRQEGGEGQVMLGRVLRAFSIYDKAIGYCQGLGFLVGPLLMHMNEKEAFCVLVRLMEHYDLRTCFTPTLYGLQLRMHQYASLLSQHLPDLAAHFTSLGIAPTYAAQWFLSLFAVTCPLPILLRIYDVIFAEGAPETMMRVALSLMKRNSARLLAMSEFEDVMQTLLSRGLWDTYNCSAEALMEDFASMSGLVTRETLGELERCFKEDNPEGEVSAAQKRMSKNPASELQAAAARFLGRLWGGSTPQLSLSPANMMNNRKSRDMMQRTNSKQSFTSTVSSYDSMQSDASVTTAATTVSRRNSGRSIMSRKPNATTELHQQIEDLLMAMGTLQREQAAKEEELDKIRTEREEERSMVRRLLVLMDASTSPNEDTAEELSKLCETLSTKLGTLSSPIEEMPKTPLTARRVSSEASQQLVQELEHTRAELESLRTDLATAERNFRELGLKLEDQSQDVARLKKKNEEIKTRWELTQKEKTRLEKQLSDIRLRKGSFTDEAEAPAAVWEPQAPSGLREFRLGRAPSSASSRRSNTSSTQPTPAQPAQQTSTFNKRTSSLGLQSILTQANSPTTPTTPRPISQISTSSSHHSHMPSEPAPAPEIPGNEALLMELVASKTAEAEAKQLAEEYKSKLDALKRQLRKASQSSVMSSAMTSPGLNDANRLTTFNGMLGPQRVESVPQAQPQATGVFGGWGWGKK